MGVVQDPKVQAIIDRELVKYLSHEPRERTRLAFRSLQERRQGPEPLDINLAAAEHYLFARFLAGRTGEPLVRFAPTLYGIKKRAYFALGIGQRMAVTSNPVLPPNADVERWGNKGADDGLADYTAATHAPASNYGTAVSVLCEEALRYNK